MALVGNLRDFGLSEFLYLVDRGYKTGKLTLTTQGDQAELYFQNGKLVYATRYGQDERIGELLVRMGRISQEQLQQALRIQHTQEQNKPLGQILVGRQMVTQDEIYKCVRLQIEEITYALFGWNEGDFRFQPEASPPDESVTIPLSIENIIMEGTRRIDEWARIKDRIPSLDVVVRFSDQPHEKAKGVNLTPDEWRVFARINGMHSIRQIAQQTGLGDFEVARIIYGFLSAGLVVLTKQVPTSPGSRNGRSEMGGGPASTRGRGGSSTDGNNGSGYGAQPEPKGGLRPVGQNRPGMGIPPMPGGGGTPAKPTKGLIRRLIEAISKR